MNDGASIHQRLEDREAATLAPAAARSRDARRRKPESPSELRTEFQRDRDRIIHTKAFRRLMHKTQVFIAPTGDHYRTRLTHTLEVTQIARTIARALRLNEDLVEAIGMGHDLGHTPFGHAGETAMADVLPGFRHNEQSLRIVDQLEKDGEGLNLTEPVRDGILRHSKPNADISGAVSGLPSTLEGHVLKVSDGVAYINHDLDDAIRAELIAVEEIPAIVIDRLGSTHAGRINTLVLDIVRHSVVDGEGPRIAMSEPIQEAANALRRFLFDRVYTPLNEREDTLRAQHVVRELCAYYLGHPESLPAGSEQDPVERRVADYVASMTDRYAVESFTRLFVPRYWSV